MLSNSLLLIHFGANRGNAQFDRCSFLDWNLHCWIISVRSLIRRRSTSLNLIIYRYKYRYSQICLRFSSATSAAPNAREALEEKRNQRVLYSKLESQDDGAGARHALEHVFVPATFLDLSKLTSSSRSWQAFSRLFFPRTLPRFLQPFTMISLLLVTQRSSHNFFFIVDRIVDTCLRL